MVTSHKNTFSLVLKMWIACGKTVSIKKKRFFIQFLQEIRFYRHLRTLQLLFENCPRRPIFIDGCNVGFNHSQHSNFSVEGLEAALNTLAGLGHTAVAVVPRNK